MTLEESVEEALLQSVGEWEPFTRDEKLWHTCPAHEWERIAWDLNRRSRSRSVEPSDFPPRIEMVTRCSKCGAPRCMNYHYDEVDGFPELDDAAQQFFRCTLERHHEEPHDFLSGIRVEVGG